MEIGTLFRSEEKLIRLGEAGWRIPSLSVIESCDFAYYEDNVIEEGDTVVVSLETEPLYGEYAAIGRISHMLNGATEMILCVSVASPRDGMAGLRRAYEALREEYQR